MISLEFIYDLFFLVFQIQVSETILWKIALVTMLSVTVLIGILHSSKANKYTHANSLRMVVIVSVLAVSY